MYNYIAIEGNIGSGKTSLAKMLAEDLSSKLILEQFSDNPFLPKFYKEPEKHSFPLELSFVAERYHQLKTELLNRDLFSPKVMSDYYIQKCLIFAQSTLKDDEFDLFNSLFRIVEASLPEPDLIVYLYKTVHNLQKNINKRGRDFEQEISDDYLHSIQENYFNFFKQKKGQRIVIIDTNELDFVANPGHYQIIKKEILKKHPKRVSRILLNHN